MKKKEERNCLGCNRPLPENCHALRKFHATVPPLPGEEKKTSCKQLFHSKQKRKKEKIFREWLQIQKKNTKALNELWKLRRSVTVEELLAAGVSLDIPITAGPKCDQYSSVLVFVDFEVRTIRSDEKLHIFKVDNSNPDNSRYVWKLTPLNFILM